MRSKDKIFYSKKTLNLNGNVLDLCCPKIMGILNLTPDSFYDGGKHVGEQEIISYCEKLIDEGADIIDIGGYSSRPGAEEIDQKEEENRVLPVLKMLVKRFPNTPVSIDTFRPEVAQKTLDSGASIINDITGGDPDGKMYRVVGSFRAAYVMMHMRGTPQNMMTKTDYYDLIKELIYYFNKKLHIAAQFGVKDVVIDVGFGFSKTIEQNYELLRYLQYFQALGVPLLAGISRKSMIYKTLVTDPDHALNGTTVLNTIALINGASILRVHDVKEAKETIKLYNKTYH